MRVIVANEIVKRLVEKIEGQEVFEPLKKELDRRINMSSTSDIEINFTHYGKEVIEGLLAISKEHGYRSLTNQIGTYRRMLENPNSTKIVMLPHVETGVKEWLLNDIIKGWIFERTKIGLVAWVVESVNYEMPRQRDEAQVVVRMSANVPTSKIEKDISRNGKTVTIHSSSLPATIDDIMLANNIYHETEELHEEYIKSQIKFNEIIAKPNKQFVMKPGEYLINKGYYNEKYVIGKNHRAINDETLVHRVQRNTASRNFWDNQIERLEGKNGIRQIPDDAFTEMPNHHSILVFDLQTHKHVWSSPENLEEYVYDTNKTDLIVLPEEHRDLIDILTTDADILIEDVVEGKTGGTTILLEGEPGTGKTLLAEVYAERMGRALYMVQAGQLGITPDSVAEGLVEVYQNAERWNGNAVILIDEADVYIRERGSDMEHNAVVAAMLIAMERQTEITFFATNRQDDVDEAILSRCIAIVHFNKPNKENSKKIWKIQAKVVGLDISDETIDEIVEHHNENGKQRASGRDIRALLKLAYRYHKHRGQTVDAEMLKQLGAFKRL